MSYYTRSPSVKELSSRNFSSNGTINVQGNVIVCVYANWCGHCKDLVPVWEQLGKKFPNKIGAVDCGIHKEVAQSLGVKGFPTIIAFKNGKPAARYSGQRDFNSLAKWIQMELAS